MALDALREALAGWRADEAWSARAADEARAFGAEVARLVAPRDGRDAPPGGGHRRRSTTRRARPASSCAPRARRRATCTSSGAPAIPTGKGYHVEYGYSCMGYEIPGGMGVKLAAPERDVFVLVGDGSYLMMPGDLATAVAEGIADRRGASSTTAATRRSARCRARSARRASGRTTGARRTAHRRSTRRRSGPAAPLRASHVDLAANAESLGLRVLRARASTSCAPPSTRPGATAARSPCTSRSIATRACPSYEGWWDVPVAEVSDDDAVRAARAEYERARAAPAHATWRHR